MASFNPIAWWRGFLNTPNSHPAKVLGVSLLVAFFCSVVVSFVSVTLKPLQEANRIKDQSQSLVELLDVLGGGLPEPHFVALRDGSYVDERSEEQNALPTAVDSAGLGKIETVATVYEVRRDGVLERVILPVRGAGYQSTLRGYLALEQDLNTVAALMFYEQDETPGMGARITEDAWAALWAGKKVADDTGTILIEVVEGQGAGPFEVDGISGATRTGSGVTNLVQFWLGPNGYGPYLERLKTERGS